MSGDLTFARFHNALRILLNVEQTELAECGVIRRNDDLAYAVFAKDPYRFFIRASDEDAQRLWRLIESRQKPVFAEPVLWPKGEKP